MRIIAICLALLASSLVGAQTLTCYQSERFGQRLINTGDSERAVIELEPDREVRLETKFGGAAGWRYDFYKRERTIQIYVRSGVVVRICRVPG
ncbi:MAG: hypothetical protein KGY48_07180 [Wenzhouxiangellaceae bacterium]|nr:hypothetical protein [Wenzhouxiangellaceae bacterium]MBS3746780.1 hypothetical protein [Wenzhouxiangellaceae bacterium]MBS3823523.1 hypothetical protein [Wenzhouxiangellaceae bacterium]